MGLIQAASGAIGGTLGDQWKDFLTVPDWASPSAAIIPAESNSKNAGRGSNENGSSAIVSNGSKIVVPEGYGLLLIQDGAITAFVSEAGAYIWNSDDPNSQSVFAGDSFAQSLLKTSWERFKFGGIPGSQQLALFVRTTELPNNKFGTQSEVYWNDDYLNAQVGAIAHGTYSYRITDPMKFAVQFVPATFLQGIQVFDFSDPENDSAVQLRSEVIASLSAAFSDYANLASGENRITRIQSDSIGFSKSLESAVERGFGWGETRGISLTNVAILGIEYDADSKELLKTVQRADALSGARGNANLQASVAEGIQNAGSVDGSQGILGIGIASGVVGVSGLMQQPAAAQDGGSPLANLADKLTELKTLFDSGLINKKEFDAAKAKAIGLE
jgi:membrane protease subunit (stomatin/prohibitin family)